MKTINSTLLTLIIILTTNTLVISQEIKADSALQKNMRQIAFMEGQWEGSGWMMGPDRKKHEFVQTENISYKLDGTALLIEGRGVNNGLVIHDALAIINYDKEKGHYNFRSYLRNGRSGDYKAEIMDDKLFWYPSSFLRYIITINENGQWYEIGEINKDGNWYQFFEMTLTKNE